MDNEQKYGIDISNEEKENLKNADKTIQERVKKDLEERKEFENDPYAPQNMQGTEDYSKK